MAIILGQPQKHQLRRNDFMTQGLGSVIVGSRALQQKQWSNVMKQVCSFMGKPEVLQAIAVVKEFDYNDRTNKMGGLESKTVRNVKESIVQ